jgi:hypothetical protein
MPSGYSWQNYIMLQLFTSLRKEFWMVNCVSRDQWLKAGLGFLPSTYLAQQAYRQPAPPWCFVVANATPYKDGRLLPSGLYRRVDWNELSNVLEVRTASNISANIALCKASKLIPVYPVLLPRRQPSSYSQPWELELIPYKFLLAYIQYSTHRLLSDFCAVTTTEQCHLFCVPLDTTQYIKSD